MGFNCAEAVNFAPADWLRFGELSRERYRAFRKPSLLCHEWLLFKVTGSLRADLIRSMQALQMTLPIPCSTMQGYQSVNSNLDLSPSRTETKGLTPCNAFRIGKLLQDPTSALFSQSRGPCCTQVAVEEKSVQTSFYVNLDLQRLIQEELEWRCRLWQEGMKPPASPACSPA